MHWKQQKIKSVMKCLFFDLLCIPCADFGCFLQWVLLLQLLPVFQSKSAISELPFSSVWNRLFVQNHSHENCLPYRFTFRAILTHFRFSNSLVLKRNTSKRGNVLIPKTSLSAHKRSGYERKNLLNFFVKNCWRKFNLLLASSIFPKHTHAHLFNWQVRGGKATLVFYVTFGRLNKYWNPMTDATSWGLWLPREGVPSCQRGLWPLGTM